MTEEAEKQWPTPLADIENRMAFIRHWYRLGRELQLLSPEQVETVFLMIIKELHDTSQTHST